MRILLRDIANIQTGVFARTIPLGDIVYLQARHFDGNGQLITIMHPDLMAQGIFEKHLLQPGDVLFAAKGTKNFAVVYESKNPPAVASTTFFVIRILSKNILPEYLAWVLNNSDSQEFLKKNAIGSSMVSISKAVLEELEIPMPTIHKQEQILKIANLSKRENNILLRLTSLRQQLIQQQLIKAIK